MTKSIELPKANYKITKVEILNNFSFYIEIGATYQGNISPAIVTNSRFIFNGTGNDWLSTSPVKDFELLSNNMVKIITENSIYLLEEVHG